MYVVGGDDSNTDCDQRSTADADACELVAVAAVRHPGVCVVADDSSRWCGMRHLKRFVGNQFMRHCREHCNADFAVCRNWRCWFANRVDSFIVW